MQELTIAAALATDELPTREEVIEVAEAGELLAYTAEGKRVLPETDRRLRCHNCDAPSGEVTLQRVASEKFGVTAYVCLGGDCAGSRNRALSRMFERAYRATRQHLTSAGKALRWVMSRDGTDFERNYTYTPREVARRKSARKVAHDSRAVRLQRRVNRRRKSGRQS
jgi:hypothetical protein